MRGQRHYSCVGEFEVFHCSQSTLPSPSPRGRRAFIAVEVKVTSDSQVRDGLRVRVQTPSPLSESPAVQSPTSKSPSLPSLPPNFPPSHLSTTSLSSTTTTATRRSIHLRSPLRAARDRPFLANYRSTGRGCPSLVATATPSGWRSPCHNKQSLLSPL
jgi:hypothetical protein